MKQQWYIQNISALRALICYEFLKKLHEKSMIFPKMKMEIQFIFEINGLINSKSHETQMKPKWTSIENNWNLIENQMKVQSKVHESSIETQLKLSWKSNETQLKFQWESIENQLKIKRKSIEKIGRASCRERV